VRFASLNSTYQIHIQFTFTNK